MELLDLPPEILGLICSYTVQDIGIRPSILLRGCSRTFNKYMLEAIDALPTFDTPDHVCEPHLAFDLRMDKALVAGLIRSKLRNRPRERALTSQIMDTMSLVVEIFGVKHEKRYEGALARLAAEGTPLHQVIQGLSRGSDLLNARHDPVENALAAALHLDERDHVLELLNRGARTQTRTKWFDDPMVVAACNAKVETFLLVLSRAFENRDPLWRSEDPLPRKLATSRLAMALEYGAAKGRADLFDLSVWAKGRWAWVQPSPLEVLKPSLLGATLAGHDHVQPLIFELLQEHGIDFVEQSPEYHMRTSFWLELLRLAAANDCQKTLCLLLGRTTLHITHHSLDLPLQDACRCGHTGIVRMLLSCSTPINLRSCAGAMYWTARNAQYDLLELLFRTLANWETLFEFSANFEDALSGASIHGTAGFRAVFAAAAEHGAPAAPADLDNMSMTQIIDAIWLDLEHRFPTGANTNGDYRDPPQDDSERLVRACSREDFPGMRRMVRAMAGSTGVPPAAAFTTAIQVKSPSILQYLCEAFPDSRSFTIELNARFPGPCSATFRVLLDHGWNIESIIDRTKSTMLGHIAGSEETARWLLSHNANPNTRGDWDVTPLSNAVVHLSLSTLAPMLRCGGDTRRGQLLHHAIVRQSADQLAVIDMLLAWGASIDAREFENDPVSWTANQQSELGTALHKAAQHDRVDAAALLLARGADSEIQDTDGRTAGRVARRLERSSVVILLRQHEHRQARLSNQG